MAIETAVNGVHTTHMVEKYIGTGFDAVQAIAGSMPLIESIAAQLAGAVCGNEIDNGRITEEPTTYCTFPSDGNTSPAGAQGVQGPQGVTGAQGASGSGGSGSVGAQGAQGAAGTNGTNGAQGAQGAAGSGGTASTPVLYYGMAPQTTAVLDGVRLPFSMTRQIYISNQHYDYNLTKDTFTINDGLFNVKVSANLYDPLNTTNGQVNTVLGVELVAKVTSSEGDITYHRDAVGFVNSYVTGAQLHLDFYATGKAADFKSETVEFFIATTGTNGAPTMKTMLGNTHLFLIKVADAPSLYVPSNSNNSVVGNYGNYDSLVINTN